MRRLIVARTEKKTRNSGVAVVISATPSLAAAATDYSRETTGLVNSRDPLCQTARGEFDVRSAVINNG